MVMASKRPSVGDIPFVMIATLALSVLLLVAKANVEGLTPSRSTSRFVARPRLPPFFLPPTTTTRASRRFFNPRMTTELEMGLRNILGKVRKNKDDDDYDDDDDDGFYDESPIQVEPPSAGLAQLALPPDEPPTHGAPEKKLPMSPLDVPIRSAPLRMGEDPQSKEINVNILDQTESVQERINRVKSGKMTQEEKQAFLKAALSTGNTPETRLPLRPPSVPKETDGKKTRASPFPEDPILRSIAGGKDPAPAILSKQLIDKAGGDSQKKKREYLDMVTDPHRFDVFRSQPKSAPRNARLNPSSVLQGQGGSLQNFAAQSQPSTYSYSNGKVPPQQQMANATSEAADSYPSSDLGTRLEAAAIVQEQQRKQQEEQLREAEIQTRRQENERQRAAAAKAAEEERRRQEILAQREKEYRERRRQEEEAMARESAKAREEEEQRLAAMLEAQESFWRQKLARERELREQRLREEHLEDVEEPAAPPVPMPQPSMKPDPLVYSPSQGGNNLSQQVFNPDESSILEGALSDDDNVPDRWDDKVDGERNQEPPPVRSYLNDVASSGLPYPSRRPTGRYGNEEERDEQLERLRELNSPLPSRPPQSRYDTKKRTTTSFQPQRPAVSYSRPVPTPNISNGATQLRNGSSQANGNSYPATPPPPSPAPAAYSPPPAPPVTPPPPAPANPLNGFFGGSKPSPSPARRPAPAKRAANPSERKGPIRMRLPIDEDDGGYDEEEGINASSNKKMSIADAMKQSGGADMDPDERSKKWGIDMSKFM